MNESMDINNEIQQRNAGISIVFTGDVCSVIFTVYASDIYIIRIIPLDSTDFIVCEL